MKAENQTLWGVVEVKELLESKGNIIGHVWKSKSEADKQADHLALNGSLCVVYEMTPKLLTRPAEIVREVIGSIEPVIKPKQIKEVKPVPKKVGTKTKPAKVVVKTSKTKKR